MKTGEISDFSSCNRVANRTLQLLEVLAKGGELTFQERRFLREVSVALLGRAMGAANLYAADQWFQQAGCEEAVLSDLEVMHLVNDAFGFSELPRNEEWRESFILSCEIVQGILAQTAWSAVEAEIARDFLLALFERTTSDSQRHRNFQEAPSAALSFLQKAAEQ